MSKKDVLALQSLKKSGLHMSETKLKKDSVINVSQLAAIDKNLLVERICQLKPELMKTVNAGLKHILAIS